MTAKRVHPYTHFIKNVQKPSQYLGGEHGECVKDFDAMQARVCLAFPDLYEIGMSHLGFKILYGLLNDDPRIAAERAYAPWADMETELRSRNEPLRSLETWHALSEFDVVGFSLQFELTYTNVLLMLELGGIPLRSEARGESDPLVIAGGPTATHAEPMAPFFDAMLIGDGEERTKEIALLWTDLKTQGVARHERLRALATLRGVYVPCLYSTKHDPTTGFSVVDAALAPEAKLPVERAFVADLNAYPFPSNGPVAATQTIFDRVSVEIARGCTEGCRFCQAGMIYRPVREREPSSIVSSILASVKDGGYDEASLTCLSTADYSAIAPLVKDVMRELDGQKVSLSVSSLRAYGLGEELLDEIQKVRATGLTFAPEAGSQRMRDVVNKNVTEAQLLETAERVFSRGWAKMKLYFMIGLPTEEDEDVVGIVETGQKALTVGRRVQRGSSPKVVVSVSTHVPKPHTPFQWCAMDSRDEVVRKQALLRSHVPRNGVQLRMHDSVGSFVEGVLARGDRTLANVVEGAYRRGARFDSWEEQLKLDAWQAAITESGIDANRFLSTIPVDARLPWDHIDVGLEDGFLAREYRKALKNRLSPPCGKAAGMFIHHTNLEEANADARRLVCYDCGVACDMQKMREERKDFLVQLGATKKPIPREPLSQPRTPNERRPKANFAQGTPVRIRLGYTKLGRAAFSSHLDLVRLLPRLFRRLELPVYYSQGFHPKPDMVFGPALSLGVASLAEYVDVKLAEDAVFNIDDLATRLSSVSLDGIHFTGATLLGPHDPGLNRIVDESEYVAALSRPTLGELNLLDARAVQARIDERTSGPMIVRRMIEGIGKNVDVSQYLVSAIAGQGQDHLDAAGILGDLLPISIRIRITGNGSAKAQEALDAVLGENAVNARLVRVGLFGSRMNVRATPLQIEAHRKPASSSNDAPAQAIAE